MMIEGYQRWADLERETGTQLMVKTGVLNVSPNSSGRIQALADTMNIHSLPNTIYLEEALAKNFRPQISLPDHFIGLLDLEGGILKADDCLLAFQSMFKRYGGTIKDAEGVESLVPGKKIRVKTNKGEYTCDSVVLCMGPWSGPFLKSLGLDLPLKAELIKVCYWKSTQANAYSADHGFPCLIADDEETGNHFFGLPALEYPDLFKFCLHNGSEIDPDNRDLADSTEVLEAVKRYVDKHFPLLEKEPAIVENCIYTWTPDSNFILDRHPIHSNIVIGAGFSGHGFKLSPIVGEILANFVDNTTQKYSMDLFKIDRFSPKSKL